MQLSTNVNETTQICTVNIYETVDFEDSKKIIEFLNTIVIQNQVIGFVFNMNDSVVEISLFDMYSLIKYKRSPKLISKKFGIVSEKHGQVYKLISELCNKTGWNLYFFKDEERAIDWMINS